MNVQPDLPYYRLSRRLTLLGYFGLLASLAAGAWLYGPETVAARIVLWLLGSAGLLLVLPGLLRGSRRSYQWLCFILLMYFVWFAQAVFAIAQPQGPGAARQAVALQFEPAGYELAALCFAVFGFISSMFAARGRARRASSGTGAGAP